ncbi:hypothetical protein RF11_00035 [Thelohanellus kitauei]|uniref:Paired domain-containing protein n=1 Tax=Thelohanellus kitauei TaxID=669202 RepID=A0A0C2N326_THEKT|nr:hypothetical protein RF11_00035 [Thelohanellus kitauei]
MHSENRTCYRVSHSFSPNNKLSDLDRKRIVDAYQKGQKASEISLVLGVARSMINSVIKIFNKSGRIDSNRRGYIKPEKLNEDQKEMIKSWVDDNAGIPLRNICHKSPGRDGYFGGEEYYRQDSSKIPLFMETRVHNSRETKC